MYRYALYGTSLLSRWRFPYGEGTGGSHPQVRLDQAPDRYFDEIRCRARVPLAAGDWVSWATLDDGRVYIRWIGLMEAVVSGDGGEVRCRALPGAPPEVLHGYLLGATLSFALINLGIEPLHATVIVVDGAAVGLMGDCGYGKSSLAAAFLAAGHRVLTDDLLVLSPNGTAFTAEPGAPRIKLFPNMARRILGPRVRGTPMNGLTPKMIIALSARQRVREAVPLRALYVLSPPGGHASRVQLRRLTGRAACLALVQNTFNMAVTDAGRLQRQLALTGSVATRVPMKRLSYPRRPAMLAAARDAILTDLSA